MCETTIEGYKMKDGTIIPFYGANIKHISPKHIMELSQSSPSTWELFLIRDTMHTLRTDVQKIVNQTIAEYPGKKLKSVSGIAAQFNKIFMFLERISVLGIILYLILKGG